VLKALLQAGVGESITKWLKAQNVRQVGQAKSMLDFLGVLCDKESLAEEVDQWRYDAERVVDVLISRCSEGYVRAGCEQQTMELVWHPHLARHLLDRLLKGEQPFLALKPGSRDNAIACLWALREILLDGQWLRRQIMEARPRARKFEAGAEDPQESPAAGREGPDGVRGRVLSARLPVGNGPSESPSTTPQAPSELARQVSRRLVGFEDPDAKLPVSFDDGTVVSAYVTFDATPKPEYFAELGRQLQLIYGKKEPGRV
jgi:hypothetical protein